MAKSTNSAVITGSTGGIGSELCKILAAQGWNLVTLNRSLGKSAQQIAELKKSFPQQNFHSYSADLMELSSVASASKEINFQHPEVSALYNVAGILTDKRKMSAQGVESHFAINVLAPYLITKQLRSSLAAASGPTEDSVVVNFSSSAIKGVKELDVSKLLNPTEIGGLMGAYAKSKMAITIAAEFLREEFAQDGIQIQTVDPGPTKTPMTGSDDGMPFLVRLLQPILFKSPEVQAQKLITAVHSAVKARATGTLISEGKQKPLPPIVVDRDLQQELRTLLDQQIEPFSS
ncbi:MAG: SDR family NAD(P)-dependent oxidoreductase [Verrucomicrobiota bacterium]